MKELQIRWQRLVDEADRTCDRCGATGAAVKRAVELLHRSLRELGIEVVLKTEVLDPATFARDPLESNRIWIGGVPIEWWLSATSGRSQCCSACGDAECRTMTVDGRTYEAIPVELIVKAGLLAAARLLRPEGSGGRCDAQGTALPAAGCALPSSRCECG
jgi:hypothetical protein